MIVLNICKTIENVNNIADNSLQKAFKHKLAHSCTYILVDICEDSHCLRTVLYIVKGK